MASKTSNLVWLIGTFSKISIALISTTVSAVIGAYTFIGRRTLVKSRRVGSQALRCLGVSEAGAPAQYLGGLDAIIAATGYQDNRAMRMLQNVLTSPPPVTLETDQDFRLRHASGPGIYLMNHMIV